MQVFPRKRNRFFYPAGLISLVLLPLLGYFYLYNQEELQQKYILDINFWHPKTKYYPDPNYFPHPQHLRKYIRIKLTGNKVSDNQNLIIAQLAIRKILAKKDTIKGVHFIFSSKAKYGSYIQSLNICLIEGAKQYMPFKNNIWVIYQEPKQKTKEITFCPSYANCLPQIIDTEEVSRISKINIKPFWPAGILYIIMVCLTAQKVRNQLRNPE